MFENIRCFEFKHKCVDVRLYEPSKGLPFYYAESRRLRQDKFRFLMCITDEIKSIEEAKSIICDELDSKLSKPAIHLVTADGLEHQYHVLQVSECGDLDFYEKSLEGNYLRWNRKSSQVEEYRIDVEDGCPFWDVYISNDDIVQVDCWDGRYKA